ncbi:hypothetical protein GVN16_17935 [Emticicia sp. CRIBPO]|uniref:hypothetical protein n=1 Tax=Emticicia sp. CRIBPO TaxID=2683258 RepID=UPI00141352CB|nr:hypothetical protein [Emticicia sp. CRIBPO]NBA87656.1 hypothetical protein [Emticicia sp. CRIBPO]
MSDFFKRLVYRIMPGVAIAICIVVLIIDFIFRLPVQTPIYFIIPSMLLIIYLGSRINLR